MKRIFESGLYKVDIDADDRSVDFEFVPHSRGTIILYARGKGDLDLNLTFKEGSSWTYLWVNRSNESLNVVETHILESHVDLRSNYAELSHGNHTKVLRSKMVGSHTHLKMKGAIIAFNRLIWDLEAHHEAKHTFANMDNHAIVPEDGYINMEVIGQIDNGYSGSETHQMTRIMNLGDRVNAVVFPKLLIRENDVAASHAATVGQIDEEHIYYLMARGISRLEAVKILTKGYLMPILVDIDDEEVKNELLEEIEMKVDTQWNG